MREIISLVLAAVLLTASLSACGGDTDPNATGAVPTGTTQGPSQEVTAGPGRVDLAAFAQAVLENHEFPRLDRIDPADGEFGAVMLDNYYPGLKELDLAQIEIYLAPISFSGGELALVQAGNAADAARVKDIFQARVDAKTREGPNNYPEEVEMWQHYSAVASSGSYVMLVNNEESAAIVSEFNGLFQ